MSLAGLSRVDQYRLDEERFREIEKSSKSANRSSLKLAVDQDDLTEESDEEKDEADEDEVDEDEVDEASEDQAFEKYDDGIRFSSDIDDRHEHPVSADGSDADLEDNGDVLGEVASAGEVKHQFANRNLKPFWDAEISGNSAGRLLADQAPRGPDVVTDPGEYVNESSVVEQGDLTPYSISDGDDLGNKSTMIVISKPDIEVSSQNMTVSYLNRPLPTPPVRKSSFRKSFLSKVLANNKLSHSDMSQAQSTSANSPLSELPATAYVRAQSDSPKLDVARVVKHSGIAKLIDTPPRSKRDSVNSFTSSRSASPATVASLASMPRYSSLGPAAPPRPRPSSDEYYLSPTSGEEYPIGTAICLQSPHARDQTVHRHYFTSLPPPKVFGSQNTDPQKKSPRDAFFEAEQQQQRGTPLSPVSEKSVPGSIPDVDIPDLDIATSIDSSSNRSIRERRMAAHHKSGTGAAAPANLRIIVPNGEEEERPAYVRGERHSEGEKEHTVHIYEIPASAPQLRQPRRVSGLHNLKLTPPKSGGERVQSRLSAKWLQG